MNLSTFLGVKQVTQAEAAALLGVSLNTMNRWVTKKQVPAPRAMTAIYVWTGGQVRPDDFYDLPPLPQDDLTPAAAGQAVKGPTKHAPQVMGVAA